MIISGGMIRAEEFKNKSVTSSEDVFMQIIDVEGKISIICWIF